MSRVEFALVLVATCSAAFGSTIVIPNANTSAVGNQVDNPSPGPENIRSQELLGSGQFASVGGPLLIHQLSLRTYPGTGPLDLSVSLLNLYLSTSPKFPNGNASGLMSVTFADNIGPDNTLVYSGPVTFTSPGCAGPGVCPFDLNILFTVPFLYNPAQGRLLLDFHLTGFTTVMGTLDAVSFSSPGGSVASVNGQLDAAVGAFNFSGDIVQLGFTAVPEPASWVLLLTGALALAVIVPRRSAVSRSHK
jgi:hypothetical protein